MSGLEQMLRQTEWGDVDVMVIDLPPGTGDAQLTICQRAPLSGIIIYFVTYRYKGAVVVCTPQDLALIDAVKATNMFKKVDVPVRSHYTCFN
jgi:ATP-binding protein involved in chromosome partitioning